MLIHSPKATCLVADLCFNCREPVSEAQSPNCCSFPAHFWSPAHTTSPPPVYQRAWEGSSVREGGWGHHSTFPRRTEMSAPCAWTAGWHIGWRAAMPHVTLVSSKVWEPLRQVALSGTWGALITMPSRGPGMCSDGRGTMAEREAAQPLFQGPSQGSLSHISWGGPGTRICRAGGTAHLTRASSDSSGSGGFGADKCCTGKGWGSPSRGQQSQLALSIVLSFLQQDARSPAERGSFVFIPSTITRCWPFSWALFRATGYSLCQERRKEAGREGGK